MTAPSISIRVSDARTLADRLFSRAVSMLSSDSERQRGDLKLASRLLRVLLREYASREVIVIDNGEE
jgi:hypothetical protein